MYLLHLGARVVPGICIGQSLHVHICKGASPFEAVHAILRRPAHSNSPPLSLSRIPVWDFGKNFPHRRGIYWKLQLRLAEEEERAGRQQKNHLTT